MPPLSAHITAREPSAIRLAQIHFARRRDGTEAVNAAIGNVSLPMHPAMVERMCRLGDPPSPFARGVVPYTATVGLEETRQAFLRVIASSGLPTEGLYCQVTDGGSQAMELAILATCGPAGSSERPLLLIDPAYTNYTHFASRLGRATVSIPRTLQEDGRFTLPRLEEIERVIRRHRPGALVVIPYDNPTGQFYPPETMKALARLCVEHDLWLISDEAYRELFYTGGEASSVWGLTEEEVPGITGRRVSIETASKVWNACGLRIGALVTDHEEMHRRCVAENTASLCPNALGQWIFGALAEESPAALREWYARQRAYYRALLQAFAHEVRERIPAAVVSRPDASLYSVVEVRCPGFDALEFVLFCAQRGAVERGGRRWTLLTAPMAGFYSHPEAGRRQMRISFVEPPERTAMIPDLLAALLEQYAASRVSGISRQGSWRAPASPSPDS